MAVHVNGENITLRSRIVGNVIRFACTCSCVLHNELDQSNDPDLIVDGIKDKGVLTVLPYWNIVDMDTLDGMHLVQGLVKYYGLSQSKKHTQSSCVGNDIFAFLGAQNTKKSNIARNNKI